MKVLMILASILLSIVCEADTPKILDSDPALFKGQSRSTINFKSLDSDSWLSIKEWIKRREFKDSNPLWKYNLRQNSTIEKIGVVIKCVGVCYLYKGKMPSRIHQGTKVYEADEIETLEDSYLWIALVNGGLVRVSAKSSVSLNEFNISTDKTFTYLRLNKGHIYYQARVNGNFNSLNLPMTDQIFYPLNILQANREVYAMKTYRSLSRPKRAMYEALSNHGYLKQYESLNEKIKQKSSILSELEHKVLVNTPTISMYSSDAHFDLFHEPGFESIFRVTDKVFNFKPALVKLPKIEVMMNSNKMPIEEVLNKVFKVSKDGNKYEEVDSSLFNFSLIQTKRIPTIHLAREFILENDFAFMFDKEVLAKPLAQKFGYRVWKKNEMVLRKEKLTKMIYKREKDNLILSKSYLTGLKSEGLNQSYYYKGMLVDLEKSKNLRSKKSLEKLAFSDLEYFIWVQKDEK
ncbi:MAG: hypothetical protein N4A33_06565 [Bacteriovoracaceae bacterium]|jgi:ribosomal protein S8|nr:hypothetical protein [Bacteriovoracaceae bacterium]